MGLSDFLLMHAGGLVSFIGAALFVLLLSWLALKLVVDKSARKWIRTARWVILLLITALFVFSLFTSASVSLLHTTIDRSAGDESQRTLEQSTHNEGKVL